MSSNDFNPFSTDDFTDPADWWQWVIREHGGLISDAATRLGAAVIAGGLGIAGARLKASDSKLATPVMGVAGLFAAAFAGGAAMDARNRRQIRP